MWARTGRVCFTAIKPNFLHMDNLKPNNLVVCHGLMGSHRNFRNICRNPLIASHANCYLLDARNHGESPHTATHFVDELAEDLATFIQEKRLSRVTLMGHSMGGLGLMAFSKLYYKLQYIVDNLIIIDIGNTVGAVGAGNKDLLNSLNRMSLSGKSIQQIYHEMDGLNVSKDIIGLLKTNVTPKKGNPSEHEWRPNIPVLYNSYDNLINFTLTSVTNWKNPVDVIYGGRSDYVDSNTVQDFKRVYTNFTDANIHRIEDAGHWLHFEKPRQFLSTIDSIFQREGK